MAFKSADEKINIFGESELENFLKNLPKNKITENLLKDIKQEKNWSIFENNFNWGERNDLKNLAEEIKYVNNKIQNLTKWGATKILGYNKKEIKTYEKYLEHLKQQQSFLINKKNLNEIWEKEKKLEKENWELEKKEQENIYTKTKESMKKAGMNPEAINKLSGLINTPTINSVNHATSNLKTPENPKSEQNDSIIKMLLSLITGIFLKKNIK